MLVEVAGITQYGTDAAADLVTNPKLLAEALNGAPESWQKKNLQLVCTSKLFPEPLLRLKCWPSTFGSGRYRSS